MKPALRERSLSKDRVSHRCSSRRRNFCADAIYCLTSEYRIGKLPVAKYALFCSLSDFSVCQPSKEQPNSNSIGIGIYPIQRYIPEVRFHETVKADSSDDAAHFGFQLVCLRQCRFCGKSVGCRRTRPDWLLGYVVGAHNQYQADRRHFLAPRRYGRISELVAAGIFPNPPAKTGRRSASYRGRRRERPNDKHEQKLAQYGFERYLDSHLLKIKGVLVVK